VHQMTLLRGTIYIVCGLSWILAAFVFAFFVFQYIVQGAGLQFFPLLLSSGSVLIGLVHVVGFVSASVICFAVGVGLCARGLVPPHRLNRS
jgi:hypothetical protein